MIQTLRQAQCDIPNRKRFIPRCQAELVEASVKKK